VVSQRFDAIVVGAGVIGSAVALALTRTRRRVLVVDAEHAAGAGSTGASSAIVRFHYSQRDVAAAAWESLHGWRDWPEHVGQADPAGTASFIPTGALVLQPPGSRDDRTWAILRDLGVPYEWLDAAAIRGRFPALDPSVFGPPSPVSDDRFWSAGRGEMGGYFTPDAGYVDDPQLAAGNLMSAARLNGAEVVFGRRVVGVLRGERVEGVRLDDGTTIGAPVVVNVAGPASDRLNVLAGVTDDMTVRGRPLRVEVHVVPAPDSFTLETGGVFVTDPDLGSAFRPQSGNLVHISSIEPECDPLEWVEDPDHYDRRATPAVYERQVYRVARRMPAMPVPHKPTGIGALYDVTADWTPIFDKSSLPGFYLACGTSGNAFKLAPVAGLFMTAVIEACEAGHDVDHEPLTIVGPRTGHPIGLAAFSRRRPVRADAPRNVLA
jgi:sarcosine oxidase subunit beta